MDYSDYSRNYPQSYRDRDRDDRRDRYERSSLSSRSLSPIRSRSPDRAPLHRYIPRLSRSAGESFRERRLRDEHEIKEIKSEYRKPADFKSAKEFKAQFLEKEETDFDVIVGFSDYYSLNDFNLEIRNTKNFSVMEKYFNDLKTMHRPNQETYELMIAAAVNADQYEKATELAKEAGSVLDVDKFYDQLIRVYLESEPIKPMQAFKVLKQAGLSHLDTFLIAARNARTPVPDYIFNEKLLSLCRPKDSSANVPAAREVWDFVIKNKILPNIKFYVDLADIHYEQGDLRTATYIFYNTILPFTKVERENNKDVIDLHGLTPRVAILLIGYYLSKKDPANLSDFVVITGQGHHNKQGEKFVMRDRLLEDINERNIFPGWRASIDSHGNKGRLNISKIRP